MANGHVHFVAGEDAVAHAVDHIEQATVPDHQRPPGAVTAAGHARLADLWAKIAQAEAALAQAAYAHGRYSDPTRELALANYAAQNGAPGGH